MNNRIDWIDTAKGVGLLLVVFGHLQVPYIATWIYLFHMPLFFFLSGVVFSGRKYTFSEYIKKRMWSLLIPYLTYGCIIWLFYAIVNCFVGVENGLYGSNLDMLKGLLVQEHFWTIWFLTALFLVEIIYYLIDRAFGKSMGILSIVSAGICIFGMVRYRVGWGSLPWNLDIAFVAQGFYHTGRWFRDSGTLEWISGALKKPHKWGFISAFFVVNIVAGGLGIKLAHESLDMSVGLYGNELLTVISALSGILFVVSISQNISIPFLRYLGRNTMLIFSLHSRVVIVLCGYIYSALGLFQSTSVLGQLGYAVFTVIVIFALLIPMTEIVKRTRVRSLFGL